MASSGSSAAAMAALLQKASQQYLECRRKVSAKVDEVKALETEMQSLFTRIEEIGTSATVESKSVGRLELTIAQIEGEEPVEGAVISVEIDPEYEEETVEETTTTEVEPKETEVSEDAEQEAAATTETEEATEEKEDEEPKQEEKEDEEPKQEEKEKEAKPSRSVRWTDTAAFPATFVFDPVQSREAVVTISVAAPAQEGEESEPVKEVEIAVSSLFQSGELERWYAVKEEVEVAEEEVTSITEIIEEPVVEKEEVAEELAAPEEEATKEDQNGETVDEEKEQEEDKKEQEEEVEEENENEEQEEVKQEVATVVVEQTEEVVAVVKTTRFQVKAKFTLSKIEELTQSAVKLARQKQEAEAVLSVLEREAASLRTKYERLNASQRSAAAGSTGGIVKPRSNLLGGRGLGAAQPRVEKTRYQKVKDSISSVLTPQRQQVLTSAAIFVGSVALFHYQGHNLLA